MKRIVLILFSLALLVSCSPRQPDRQVYKLDATTWPTQTIALDKIIKEIRVIPLETRPECLISYSGDMQFTPGMIVILDGETLQINCFSPDGKFLRKFGTRGKGPGEYITAAGLLVNQEKSEIILNRSPARRFNFFNLSGQFLRSGEVEFSGYRINLINKDLVAVHAGRFGFNKINCELAILDMNGKIRKTFFPFREPVQGDQCFGFAAGTGLGSVLYHRRFDYHIYEIYADRVDTLLTIDFGKASIDTGKFLNSESTDKLMEEDGNIFGLRSLANTPDHLVAGFYTNGGLTGAWILDYRSKNQRYLAVDTLYNIGKYKGLSIPLPRQTDGSWYVANLDGIDWCEAMNKLTEAEKDVFRKEIPGFNEAEKVKIDGNPVVVKFKLMDF